MKIQVKKILLKWQKANTVGFFIIYLSLSYLNNFLVLIILNNFFNLDDLYLVPNNEPVVDIMLLLEVCFFVPILETLLLQQFVLYLMNKFTKNKLIHVIVSASLFGISHFYNITYVIFTFFQGVIFATGFILFKEKKGIFGAFLMTTIVHSTINFIALFLRII